MTKASDKVRIMRIVMRYQSGQQQWWSGTLSGAGLEHKPVGL
jgi:hypothetical protein